ncbi:hypothetical protein [Haemophilus parahaemolyticus]|nr:hypothetical protein [Haemophilus parahaemolyticus]OOR97985.1 hypothetical protein B0185_02650 [Haemophilus parahaemolyticus]
MHPKTAQSILKQAGLK